MSKLNDQLFVFSLEGALCGPQGVIAPSSAEMLQLLALRGGRYTVISDSPVQAVRAALDGLPAPGAPVVCSSGAMLYDPNTDHCLYQRQLSRPDAETMLWTLERAFPSLGLAVQICDGPFQIIRANSYTEEYLRRRGFGGILIQLENIPENWLNAALFAEPRLLAEVEDFVAQNSLVGDFKLVRRGRSQLLLVPKGAASTDALHQLCTFAGTALQDVAALGGSTGDGEWLALAGRSAATADAPADVKLAADYVLVCTAGEGAAAEFLYQCMKQYE